MTRSQPRKAKVLPIHQEEAAALKRLYTERVTVSQAAFGAESGIGTQGAVWQFLNAHTPLNADVAVKFAAALDVDVYSFSPRLAKEIENLAAGIDLEGHPGLVRVRKVIFKISAGIAGFSVDFLDNGEGTPLFYPKAWADKHKLDPAKLYAVRVSGSSMEPTIQSGDVVIVDTGNAKREKEALCAVNHEGEFTVKRLQYEHRRWWLMSDNPDQKGYPPKECSEGTYILGRVVRLEREF